uniref:Uncharacterized protein n=1 Tax=Micromonospora carbonacea TaxID=47853 RepID=A0A7D6C6G6_9ACTN|nr:hypothetical protein HZU44_01450 [Micromonospora carbonacea]
MVPALPAWPPPTNPATQRDGLPAGAGTAGTPVSPVSGVPASGPPAPDRPASGLYGAAPTTAWPAAATSGVPAPATGPAGSRAAVGVPAGRPEPGTADLASIVYGTDGPGFATVALPTGNQLDNSGSLTGHILAQGWTDAPAARSSTAKVVIVMAASLGLLVAIGVLVVLLAGDAMDGLVGGLLNS